MTNQTRISTAVAIAGFAIVTSACDGGPSSPSRSSTSGNRVVVTPTVTSVAPNVGSTSGDTPIEIMGSGLLPGVTVRLDGTPVQAHFDSRYTDRIFLSTPPHAAAKVDVLVTNPGGEPGAFLGGYTYVAPESFDFNGTWQGFPVDGSDLPLEFTIQNDSLVRISCDTTVVTVSPPLPITDGSFLFARDGSRFSGKIVSASQAVGAITLLPCNAPLWEATRRP